MLLAEMRSLLVDSMSKDQLEYGQAGKLVVKVGSCTEVERGSGR